jgi:hypothetical protein
MAVLLSIRGRILEVRRYINPSVYWRRPPGPAERYELWIRQLDGREFKITIHTRTMPARRGHMVSVVMRGPVSAAWVMGLFNASTMDAVNYMHTDPPPLLHVWECVTLPFVFLIIAACFGDVGAVLYIGAAAVYLLIVALSRLISWTVSARHVDEILADEATNALSQ